jgi:hypothetical protein
MSWSIYLHVYCIKSYRYERYVEFWYEVRIRGKKQGESSTHGTNALCPIHSLFLAKSKVTTNSSITWRHQNLNHLLFYSAWTVYSGPNFCTPDRHSLFLTPVWSQPLTGRRGRGAGRAAGRREKATAFSRGMLVRHRIGVTSSCCKVNIDLHFKTRLKPCDACFTNRYFLYCR